MAIDFSLSPEHEEVRDRARKVAEDLIAPKAKASDEERFFDRKLIREVGRTGLFGGPIRKEYGGLGLDHVAQALVYEEFGKVDSSVRGFMAVQTGLVASCIQDWASEEQKKTWLPGLVSGEFIGCYCLTEENAGSDVAAMETRAERRGDDWIINGAKMWITSGTVADVALVFAQADPDQKHKGISCFLVPTDTPGFQREKMTAPELGHRGSEHARIYFNDMKVPDACRMGEVGEGFKLAMSALDHGRVGVAAGAVGVHAACLDACVDYARKRRQFGKRLGDFQLIQKTLCDMHSSLEAARSLTWLAAWKKDVGEPATRAVSVAKLYATEAAAEAAHQAVLLHGGRGYNNDFPVERFLRDIIGLEIYEGSSNIQRIIIARDLVGRDESRGRTS